jgi:hypothetical protein
MTKREDVEGIAGGRFVPNPDLPPVREYKLQGIGIDYETYHFGQSIGVQIATPEPGASAIPDAWVQIDGTRVTAVPVGSIFSIHCNYSAVNNKGGSWLLLITCVGVGTSFARIYAQAKFNGTTLAENDVTVDLSPDGSGAHVPCVMPAGTGTLQLRFKMWMADAGVTVLPEITKW